MGAVTTEACRVVLQWTNICILLHLLDFYSHQNLYRHSKVRSTVSRKPAFTHGPWEFSSASFEVIGPATADRPSLSAPGFLVEIRHFRPYAMTSAPPTGWTVRGSNSGGGKIFRNPPDRPWGPSTSYTMSIGSFSVAWGVALTIHQQLAPRLKKE